MAWASTVAVVVPSPATSEVLDATSFTICAPRFSNLSARSMALATLTPSLVDVGAPQLFSINTLRPRGPIVTFTASASTSTPRCSARRADSSKRSSLLATELLQDREDVVLVDDQRLFAVESDFVPRVFREQDAVTLLHVHRDQVALVVALARTGGDHLALGRLLLGGVGDEQTARGLLLAGDGLNDEYIVKRPNLCRHGFLHGCPSDWGVSRPTPRRDGWGGPGRMLSGAAGGFKSAREAGRSRAHETPRRAPLPGIS